MMKSNPQTESRRGFFSKSALMLGTGAIATNLFTGKAEAQIAPAPTDLQLVNYALTLENLEAAFYVQGLNRFTANDFARASYSSLLSSSFTNAVLDNFKKIRDHEVAHVAALRGVVTSLGGIPNDPCNYNFGYNNFEEFLGVATALENTGVMAYAGAIGLIQSKAIQTAGATIATIEARHASYLNLLSGAIPFPANTDTPKSMTEILAIAGGFITSCPVPGAGGGGGPVGTIAVAGPKNLISTVSKNITLDASASTSADGKPLTYLWTVVSGDAGLSNAASPSAVVQFGNGGPYTFRLTITDSTGKTATDTVSVQYYGH